MGMYASPGIVQVLLWKLISMATAVPFRLTLAACIIMNWNICNESYLELFEHDLHSRTERTTQAVSIFFSFFSFFFGNLSLTFLAE